MNSVTTATSNRADEPLLEGVRVADFTHMLAGPSAAMALADLGATVVKVENPPEGDPSRGIGVGGALFAVANRNKASIALNLKDPRGQEVARRLIATCDVVLESLRPGVMEGWGLGYEQVSQLVPGIVYGSVVGFGSRGPERDRGGVDLVVQAESGMMNLSGTAGGPPTRVGLQLVDTAAGLALGQAVAAALYRKARTGKGTRVEVRLLDTALYLQALQIAEYSISGRLPQPLGNSNPLASPADLFRTQDGYLMLAVLKDEHWQRLCTVLELDDLAADPRYEQRVGRLQHRDEIASAVQDRLRRRSTAQWYPLLREADLLVARVRDYRDVLADEQVAENGALTELPRDGDRGGAVTAVRLPYVLDDASTAVPVPPPQLGADTISTLAQLGYEPSEIEAMVGNGVVASPPTAAAAPQETTYARSRA